MPFKRTVAAVALGALLLPVPVHAGKTPWFLKCSLRVAVAGLTVAAIAIGAYSVADRDARRNAARLEKGRALQSVPYEKLPDTIVKLHLADIALDRRQYYQSWHPEHLRMTLQYYALSHPEIDALAKRNGIPLEDDDEFVAYIGVVGEDMDRKEVRPWVDGHIPGGVIWNRDRVDELLAEIYRFEHEWALKVGNIDYASHSKLEGDKDKPWNGTDSFHSEWYRMQHIRYFIDAHLNSTHHDSYFGTYVVYRWQIARQDTGSLLLKLFNAHPEAVESIRDTKGPGMLPDLVRYEDPERFKALAAAHPYGFNRENRDFVDQVVGTILLRFRELIRAQERGLTNAQVLEEFLKVERLP